MSSSAPGPCAVLFTGALPAGGACRATLASCTIPHVTRVGTTNSRRLMRSPAAAAAAAVSTRRYPHVARLAHPLCFLLSALQIWMERAFIMMSTSLLGWRRSPHPLASTQPPRSTACSAHCCSGCRPPRVVRQPAALGRRPGRLKQLPSSLASWRRLKCLPSITKYACALPACPCRRTGRHLPGDAPPVCRGAPAGREAGGGHRRGGWLPSNFWVACRSITNDRCCSPKSCGAQRWLLQWCC